MRIPTGNFGNVVPTVRQGSASFDNTSVARAGEQLASTAQRIAGHMASEQEQENRALARVRASNLLLDRETQIRTITTDLGEKARMGQLTHDQLQGAYEQAVSGLDPLTPKGLDPSEMEGFGLSLKRLQNSGALGIQELSSRVRIGEAQSDIAQRMDILGKEAGMPGSNPESVIARMDAEDIDTAGRMAFGAGWDSKKQEFKDGIYATNATQRINAARDDMGALKQIEHDLTAEDGFYTGKLDANRRTTALNGVINAQTRLENKALAAEAKREAAAQRALFAGQQQVASGIPAPAGYWDKIGQQVRGTSLEGDFDDIIKSENQVQEVLRLPIDQQIGFVQEREAALMSDGGTVKDVAMFNRLSSAVGRNVKQMQTSPIEWAENRTGQQFESLDVSGLLSNDHSTLSAQLQDRAVTITAMRNQYGAGVPMSPLKASEATALSGALQQATPRQQGQVFGMLKQAFGDEQAFQGAMQQIYPDAPVKALAGMIYSKQRDITLQANTFSADLKASSGDVAETMLTGENILNKTKADKAGDGKSSGFPIPKEADFRSEFSRAVGAVFAGRPEAFNIAMQATRSYYTGKAAQDGDVSGEVDINRMRQSITATIGTPVEVNGGKPVLAPWGMDQDAFLDRAKAAFETEMTKRDMPAALTNNFGVFSLENQTGDTYRVVQGGDYLRDKQGQPIIISVTGGDQ